jgi:AraC-like DNA-binding protein
LDDLPPEVGERARLALWHERNSGTYAFESAFLDGRPPSACVDFGRADAVTLVKVAGTLAEITRTQRHLAADPHDDLCLSFNTGHAGWTVCQNGREVVATTGKAVLHTNGACYTFRANARSAWIGIGIERIKLAEFIANPEDLTARPFDSNSPAMRHLGRYLRLIMGPDGIGDDASLNDRIGATLIDLVALALGAGRDAGEFARLHGRRAALLREIVAEIKAGFANANFSVGRIAAKLGVSPRTVQDLLYESGRNFSERVMELRLQRARTMLTSPRCDGLKVIEIAHACGFNEVSYFNRCFRRRFGDTPIQHRGNGNGVR